MTTACAKRDKISPNNISGVAVIEQGRAALSKGIMYNINSVVLLTKAVSIQDVRVRAPQGRD